MDWSGNPLPPLFIHTGSRFSPMKARYLVSSSGPFTTNLGSTGIANMTMYVPIWLPFPYHVRRVFSANGGAVAGNLDIGLFSYSGTRLWNTGTTAISGTNTLQYISMDTLVNPGSYYLAMAVSSSSTQFTASAAGTPTNRMTGIYQEPAFGLPANASFVSYSLTYIFLFGMTMTPSGF